MSWAALIPLIVKYGVPFAQKMWALHNDNKPPTETDWLDLRLLAAQTSVSQMTDALNRAGVPLNDPVAKALLNLT